MVNPFRGTWGVRSRVAAGAFACSTTITLASTLVSPAASAQQAQSYDRAAELVTALLHRLGYEPVHLGTLAAGRDLEPGEALFSGWSTSAELDLRRAEQVRAA